MKNYFLLLALITMLLSSRLSAHEIEKSYNQIHLEVSSAADVDNDTMVVSLYALEEGSRAAELSSRVNKKINWALNNLKRHKAIKVETESYTTNPVYNKNQVIAWRVRQSIRLESQDMSLMSEVLGEMQQQLKLSGISFDVSRGKREAKTQSLIDEALAAYNKRATQVAKKLNFQSYKIVNINVSTSGSSPRYRQMDSRAMMSKMESAPAFAAGDKTLTVRVSGSIELQ
jgi:predicted secreted protein